MIQAATFPSDQLPVLMTFSAENDISRSRLFRYARGFTNFLKTHGREQARLLGRALGSYDPQITHTLDVEGSVPGATQWVSLRLLDRPPGAPRAKQPDPDVRQMAEQKAIVERLDQPAPAPVVLLAVEERLRVKPALVARTSHDVIDGHSDFFRQGFVSWLSDTVLGIQRERLERIAKEKGRR
jgi:hypothetical protein